MEEKIIIQSKLKMVAPFCFAVPLIAIIVFVIYYADHVSHWAYEWNYNGIEYSTMRLLLRPINYSAEPLIALIITLVIVIAGIVLFRGLSKTKLIITNKRAYGHTGFGKRVDLPLDSITAIGIGTFSSIAITTASGAIRFSMIKNCEEIYSFVSELLVERQNKIAATSTAIKQENPQSIADELKKFKELLDMGVISQEEFDAKKKQLLGL